jgi:hypothetical protein
MSKAASVNKGKVTRFDSTRGMAEVKLTGGSVAEMHVAAFLSGRPARLPTVGEAVVAEVRTADGRKVVVAARPAGATRAR